MHFADTVIFGLLYGVLNIIFLFIALSFSLGLIFYDAAVAILNNLMFPLILYVYCILNILIGLCGYNLTSNYGDILFRRYREKKTFFFKIELMISILTFSFSIGIAYIALLRKYMNENKNDANPIMCNIFICSLTIMSILIIFCLYMIHPDLFRTKRNAEIRALVQKIEAEENREIISI